MDALVLLAPRAERSSKPGLGRLDGIDRNERHGKQLTDTLDIVGAGLTGEEAVADAVEARWQDMHQEAADELACVERHHPVVSLGAVKAIILPLEGNALVVERDQTDVADSLPRARQKHIKDRQGAADLSGAQIVLHQLGDEKAVAQDRTQ